MPSKPTPKSSKPAPDVKIVEVVWADAWISTKDISVKKARKLKPVKRRTTGYLVAENKECVVLCTDRYDDDKKTVAAPMVIPWGWIYEYWEYEDDS